MDTFLRGGMSCDVWLFSLNFPSGIWVLGGLKLLSTHTMQKQLSIPQFCFCKQYSSYNVAPLNTDHRYQCCFKKHGQTRITVNKFYSGHFFVFFFFSFYFCKIIGAETNANFSMKLLYIYKKFTRYSKAINRLKVCT